MLFRVGDALLTAVVHSCYENRPWVVSDSGQISRSNFCSLCGAQVETPWLP